MILNLYDHRTYAMRPVVVPDDLIRAFVQRILTSEGWTRDAARFVEDALAFRAKAKAQATAPTDDAAIPTPRRRRLASA